MTAPNTMKDDITYMRQLAEHGRRGPILGGAFLAAAGVVFGITCLLQWAAVTGRLAISDREMGWIWPAAYVVFAFVWLALWFGLRSRRRAAAANSSNAVFGIAWIANAVGVTMAYATTAIAAQITHMQDLFYAFIPMIFIFYGIAWGLSAVMAHRRWMYLAAGGSFAFALCVAALTNNPAELAVTGVALVILLTVPGLKLMFEEPK
jgi:hypothetical protein